MAYHSAPVFSAQFGDWQPLPEGFRLGVALEMAEAEDNPFTDVAAGLRRPSYNIARTIVALVATLPPPLASRPSATGTRLGARRF